ncbi:MAG TPA: hypothetical protein PLY78_06875, partial [Methanospirillum sp.]|nr:hypothetical protein [Methanospirillum sp.]
SLSNPSKYHYYWQKQTPVPTFPPSRIPTPTQPSLREHPQTPPVQINLTQNVFFMNETGTQDEYDERK